MCINKSFTLVEVLVALSIFAIIAGAQVAVFYKGVDIWDDVRMKSSRREEALIFLKGLEKQLKNHIDPVNSKFTADEASVYFTTLEDVIYNVEYIFDKESRRLYKKKGLYPIPLEELKQVLILSDVESFDIDCEYQKTEPDEDAGFPQKVGIKLIISDAESKEKYEFTRTVEIPVI